MPDKQIIGSIPEFTKDSDVEMQTVGGEEAVSESDTEPVEPQQDGEKETPSTPPVEEQPTEAVESQPSDDTENVGNLKQELVNEIEGLRDARKELILELKDLRGQKRELKQQEIEKVEQKLDKLEDLNPDDVNIIDRILKAKGYIPKQDMEQMLYKAKKQDESDKFLREFPEYNEQNDPNRIKFDRLLQEVSLYKEPSDAKMWATILRRAHSSLGGFRTNGGAVSQAAKQQVKIASVGGGGVQRSSSVEANKFTPEQRQQYRAGGWSEEDIDRMEQRLSS